MCAPSSTRSTLQTQQVRMGPLFLLWILSFLSVQVTVATLSFPDQEEEDYDFINLVEMLQNDSVVINEDGVDIEMTWTEAIEAIVHADLRSLFTTPSIHSRQPASQPVVGRTILPAMYLTWPRQAYSLLLP